MNTIHGTVSADPLIWADIKSVRESIADIESQGKSTACLSQIIGFAVSVLEGAALVAVARGDGYVFDGRMSVEDARRRAEHLRVIPLRPRNPFKPTSEN